MSAENPPPAEASPVHCDWCRQTCTIDTTHYTLLPDPRRGQHVLVTACGAEHMGALRHHYLGHP